METWRPIPGWEGVYEASDAGSIRSITRTWTLRNPVGILAPRTYRGRTLKPGRCASNRRYAMVMLARPGHVARAYVHDLIAATFIGPKPVGQLVRHLNDEPHDNRACNLAYGTLRDNAADARLNRRIKSAIEDFACQS